MARQEDIRWLVVGLNPSASKMFFSSKISVRVLIRSFCLGISKFNRRDMYNALIILYVDVANVPQIK